MRKFLGILLIAIVALSACAGAPQTSEAPAEGGGGEAADTSPIIIAWYPNESGAELADARDAMGEVISEALGRPVEHQTTTDYIIAIEAVANDNAHLAWFGAEGYVQAHERNPAIQPLVIPSGDDGTLESAVYYSWLNVRRGNETLYSDGADGFTIDNIQGQRFSFVSNSSTSGFRVPSANIVNYFGAMDEWAGITPEDLLEGGTDNFFADVQFGGSHQGSAVNLISDKVDVAAFCDVCVRNYVSLVEGEANRPGAVYRVNDDAEDPFSQYAGEEFVIISSTPVINAPFVANSNILTAEEIATLQEVLTSDAVANNPRIFATEEVLAEGFIPLFEKEDSAGFLVVDDAFFQPIRDLVPR
jgi:phosphonate transport system substrate-binding protein